MLFTLFVLFGRNSELVSKSAFLTWTGIIGGAILLYVFVFGIIRDIDYLSFGLLGFYLGKIFFALSIPICLLVYDYYNPREISYQPKSLLEKEGISLKKDFEKCQNIRYGTFWNGYDTIIRYSKDKRDYETIKSFDGNIEYVLKWMDSCSYLRVHEKSGLVESHVQIGNFENGFHSMYMKPAKFHRLEEQRIQQIVTIKSE